MNSTDFPFELTFPFSLEEFKESSIGVAASRAIAERADEIRRAADAGEPPIGAMAPAFDMILDENLHYRMIERMIHEWLGPRYKRSGRKPVPISGYRRGLCYTRDD